MKFLRKKFFVQFLASGLLLLQAGFFLHVILEHQGKFDSDSDVQCTCITYQKLLTSTQISLTISEFSTLTPSIHSFFTPKYFSISKSKIYNLAPKTSPPTQIFLI